MNYKRQISILTYYFQQGEKPFAEFKIGMEIEHLVLNYDSLQAVPYFGEKGIGSLLNELVKMGWKPIFELENLLKLENRNATITLEPGGQLELSIKPRRTLKQIEKIYFDFLEDVVPLLEKRNQVLACIGYHPQSSVKDIPLLPKDRYRFMHKYFQDKGKFAHNMMKGTASLQVSIDYESEQDYRKKNRVAYFLAPLIYTLFDNSPFFEGRVADNHSIRSLIWNNCDFKRCGEVRGLYSYKFGYEDYARYLLNVPPIIAKKGDRLIFTGDKLIKELFNPDKITEEEIKHFLSMVFPDVRTKNYLEIRVGDSLPFPYSLAFVAMIKGLFYNRSNLNSLYKQVIELDRDTIYNLKQEILKKGRKALIFGSPIFKYFNGLLNIARDGLDQEEKTYLSVLVAMFEREMIPKMRTINQLHLGKKKALDWCMVKI